MANVGEKFEVVNGGGFFNTGEIVTLVKLEWDGIHQYRNEKGNTAYAADARLVKIENEEVEGVMKANVGDKFEVVEGRGVFSKGEIVTLVRYDGDGCNKYENEDGRGCHMLDRRLKKIVVPQKGDKFTVTGNSRPRHYFQNGSTVSFLSLVGDGKYAMKNDEDTYQHVNMNDVTPYVASVEPKPVNRFYVGDEVSIEKGARPYSFAKDVIGTVTSTDAHGRGHRGKYMVAVPSVSGGTYEIGFKEDEIMPVAKKAAKEGDYIVIDLVATEEYGGASTVDITEGRKYLVRDDGNGLYFNDDDGDTRSAHIEEGFYTIVDAPDALSKSVFTAVAPKFQEGDYVVSLSGSPYYITDESMTLGKVLDGEYASKGEIDIEVVAHDDSDYISDTPYSVDPQYFRKATESEIAAVTPTPVAANVHGPNLKGAKVGDKIRITGNGTIGNTNPHFGNIGDIEEVESTRNDRVIVANANAVRNEFFELVAEAIEGTPGPDYSGRGRSGRDFKVGEKVLVLRSRHVEMIGNVYTVTEDSYGMVSGGNVALDNGKIALGDNVELVVDETPASTALEVGDLAEVIADGFSDDYNSHDIKIGTIVKVKSINSGKQKYVATVVGKEDSWDATRHFVEGDLRKVDAVIPEPVAEEVTFEVGDIVRLVANEFDSANKVGDIGEVIKVDNSDDTLQVEIANTNRSGIWSEFTDVELIAKGRK